MKKSPRVFKSRPLNWGNFFLKLLIFCLIVGCLGYLLETRQFTVEALIPGLVVPFFYGAAIYLRRIKSIEISEDAVVVNTSLVSSKIELRDLVAFPREVLGIWN